MTTQVLKIDEEFAALIPPLTYDEYSRLEKSIIDDGCRDAIILWDDIIVEGQSFTSREDAMLWMLRNQFYTKE